MPNKTNSKVSDLIYGLERINEIIDLCIDRELYEYVDRILRVGRKCSQFLRKLRDTDGKTSLEEFDFSEISFPILSVGRPRPEFAELFKYPSLFKSEKPPFELSEKGKDFPVLKSWSDLFWAKRVRAELQKHNQADWLDRYEDLTVFLETRMPSRIPPGGVKADFYATQFNYLMELSAVTRGEASLGYAERARRLVRFFHDDSERGPYDRWIWWNMGTAYQHIGRSRKAVLEFNQIIRKFDINLNRFDSVLEYLVNIVPAYLQRAAINLKLQLGYHALQTLEEDIDKNLNDIEAKYPCKLIGAAVKHLETRIELHRIEALLQLEMLKEAQERLERSYCAIFHQLEAEWKATDVKLPPTPIDHYQLGVAIATQFVEHAVNWWQQEAERIVASIRNPQASDKHQEDMASSFKQLTRTIEVFQDYWEWIKGNKEDERIFYSRWAQIIKFGIETVCELDKLKKANSKVPFLDNDYSDLLEATIQLYLLQSDKLPIARREKHLKSNFTIELENFRSDDLPDFSSGLSTFYKKMGDILLRSEEEGLSQDLKALVGKKLTGVNNGEPVDYLKKHHIQLLDALDEYEIEFGENQKIKSLKRCNERLFLTADVTKECKGCLKEPKCNNETKVNVAMIDRPYYFHGVLACQDRPVEKLDKFLYGENYQRIMEKAEEDFIKHLETPSRHKPHKEGLHFVGLQRWNSLTPAQGRSVGGGYLIYRTDRKGNVDLGIAIDPGFDFVRNLFRMGFSLRDIDIVIISHAHPDHLWDFETLVQLLGELERKKKITHRLNVIMTLGIYERLRHIIKNPKLRKFINPLVVDIRKEIDQDFYREIGKSHYNFRFKKTTEDDKKLSPIRWTPILPLPGNQEEGEIEISPTHAYHEDYTDISDSFGFVISIRLAAQDSNKFLGYTGDTKWVDKDLYPKEDIDVASQYTDCDVLLFHIGSLIDHKNRKTFKDYNEPDKCERLIRRENHPYLMGTIRFLKKLGYPGSGCSDEKIPPKKLILLGEFGEELRGGIRTDLVKRLQGEGFSDWQIVPVDVGFDVLLCDDSEKENESCGSFKFLCALCDEHRPIREIDYFRFGQDEAIFHICKTCKKAIPDDVRQNKLRQLYEIGRELKPAIECDVY